ncbi:MAG: hypothetical protein P1P90_03125 [Patescibacteria group bacterium]|nr:hypothetical protein [Patescibacteria group bacterium]
MYRKSVFGIFLMCLFFFVACDGGESTECVCTDGVCACPVDYGLEKTEVFITYSLKDGQEAPKAGMEVEGIYQLMYENVEAQPISCKTVFQDTEKKLQCSLGRAAVGSEIRFMIMVPEGDKMVPACQTSLREDCRGTLKVEILRENGKSEFPNDMLVVDGNFEGDVAYRVRIEE